MMHLHFVYLQIQVHILKKRKKEKKVLWSLDSSFELKSFFYVFFHSAGYFDGLLACEMCLDSSLED